MHFDVEITHKDIQQLGNANAVAAFFAKLGYNTDVRIEQAPANLGITAEGTLRPIKRVELVADQEGFLQVYLFEVSSVTVSHTRALVRAFRERAGNYLLVLTSDYERIDFVLAERFILPKSSHAKGIAQQQARIRPRVLTVNRRSPSRVDLRVLRRFTFTEEDAYAQYDKLVAAYGIADWSEEHFNNRALFSDYFLTVRLPEQAVWKEDPKSAFEKLVRIYQGASTRIAGQPADVLRKELFEPTLNVLGFDFKEVKNPDRAAGQPDYSLLAPSNRNKPVGLALVYPWGRYLDGKDDKRDTTTQEDNPGAVVVSLLEKGEAPWAVITNGRVWRLYAKKAHSRSTNYYEIDVEELLSQQGLHAGGPAEAFRYFWLLFRRQAFEPTTTRRDGKEVEVSFLDQILEDSQDYAKKLGERLKERIFEKIFPHIAEGFIEYIKERDGTNADLSQDVLDSVFHGTLTLLYRILFLLYAEARDLLPAREVRGYYEVSFKKLKEDIAKEAGNIEDEVEQKLKKSYRHDQFGLYGRLMNLFRIIDHGDTKLNVPFYNGGLFLSDPSKDDDTPEGANARFLTSTKLADRYLARALDLIARDLDDKRKDLVFIDYKSLGVRQLGSIYEGLLEFKLRIAPEKMAVVKGKRAEEIVPYQEAKSKKSTILTVARGKDAAERVLPKGTVYLENDKRERKATGSYYTPDHIVEYIVENAVGPMLREKLEALRPKVREAERHHKEFFKREEALKKKGIKPEPLSKADLIGQELVKEFFDITVCDPAMGSGHFLVEAVDFITDKTLDFLNSFPWNPVLVHLDKMRADIMSEMERQGITIDAGRLTDVNLLKRHVLKRCIYGVDLNPMAVELAKVSLWLDCFTLGAPLSFLDHHMKCGNSLIGVTVDEVRQAVEGGQQVLWGSHFTGVQLAAEGMREIGELSDLTIDQVKESRTKFQEASDRLNPYKRISDIYTSQWFGNKPVRTKRGKDGTAQNPAIDFLKSDEAENFANHPNSLDKLSDTWKIIAVRVVEASRDKRFFHWELEFPEIFFEKGARGTKAGFDAIIGNPPYVRPHKLVASDKLFFWNHFLTFVKKADLYCCLMEQSIGLLKPQGFLGWIVSNGWLRLDSFEKLRRFLLTETCLKKIIDFTGNVFEDSHVKTAILVLSRQKANTYSTETEIAVTDAQNNLSKVNFKKIQQNHFSQTYKSIFDLSLDLERQSIRQKIEIDTVPLAERFNVSFGLKTGDDAKFITDTPSSPSHKPLLRGEDVHRYVYQFKGEYVWYVPDLMRNHRKTARPGRAERFEQPKVLVRDTGAGLHATFDDSHYYVKDVLVLTHRKGDSAALLLLTGILNSKLMRYYYEISFPTLHVQRDELACLPIPRLSADDKDVNELCARVVQAVGRMLLFNRQASEKKTPGDLRLRDREKEETENEIDKLIYQLYGLTESEITVVEKRSNLGGFTVTREVL